MSNSGQPTNIPELLAALAQSVNEDGTESFKLSAREADQQLAEMGVDSKPGLEKLRGTLERAKAQARLDAAKARRERFQCLFERCQQKLQDVSEPVRQEVMALVRGISPTQSDMVEAFFRKFDQSSQKDVDSLREDLEMLRAMREEPPSDEPQA